MSTPDKQAHDDFMQVAEVITDAVAKVRDKQAQEAANAALNILQRWGENTKRELSAAQAAMQKAVAIANKGGFATDRLQQIDELLRSTDTAEVGRLRFSDQQLRTQLPNFKANLTQEIVQLKKEIEGDDRTIADLVKEIQRFRTQLADRHKLCVDFETKWKVCRDELAAVNKAAETMAKECDYETKQLRTQLVAAEDRRQIEMHELKSEHQLAESSLRTQLTAERGPLRELAEEKAYNRACELTTSLVVKPLKTQLAAAQAAIGKSCEIHKSMRPDLPIVTLLRLSDDYHNVIEDALKGGTAALDSAIKDAIDNFKKEKGIL